MFNWPMANSIGPRLSPKQIGPKEGVLSRQWAQEAYSRAWQAFETWCANGQLQALPAEPETIAVGMAAVANGNGGRKPLARSSIN
jgi:hypothetical protein